MKKMLEILFVLLVAFTLLFVCIQTSTTPQGNTTGTTVNKTPEAGNDTGPTEIPVTPNNNNDLPPPLPD